MIGRETGQGATSIMVAPVLKPCEQAQLLRAGRCDALDIEHIADEIEDLGALIVVPAVGRRVDKR
jgi:hypothetical protein